MGNAFNETPANVPALIKLRRSIHPPMVLQISYKEASTLNAA
jgi:hypothetical protein